MNLIQLLQSGGVLRYRPPHRFYVVLAGKSIKVTEAEAKKAVSDKRVVPDGIAGHGVYVFRLNRQGQQDVRCVQRGAKALPQGSTGASAALPQVRVLRGAADSAPAACVCPGAPSAARKEPGSAGGLDGARPQRGATAGAGQGHCLGCGACARGVMP